MNIQTKPGNTLSKADVEGIASFLEFMTELDMAYKRDKASVEKDSSYKLGKINIEGEDDERGFGCVNCSDCNCGSVDMGYQEYDDSVPGYQDETGGAGISLSLQGPRDLVEDLIFDIRAYIEEQVESYRDRFKADLNAAISVSLNTQA